MTTQKKKELGGLIRAVIPAVIGYLAGRGLLTPEEAEALAPLIVSAVAAGIGIWSVFSKRKQ